VGHAGREFEETKAPLGGSKRVKTGHNSLLHAERRADPTVAVQGFAEVLGQSDDAEKGLLGVVD
jgi:hypothetical protein